MDAETSAAFQPYLQPGERLQWTGRPKQGLTFGPQDIFMAPFSLVWLGGVVFMFGTAALHGADRSFLLVAPLFLGVGLYFAAGRFLVEAWIRSRTLYGLTGQRAIVLRRIFSEEFLSTPKGGPIRLKRESRGRGTIEFGAGSGLFGSLRNPRQSFALWHPSLASEVMFLGVDDVDSVFRLAQRLD